MRIVCDNCGTKYSIPDDRVRNKPFKIRCKKCSYVIVVQGAEAQGGEEPGWYVVINGEQVGPVSTRDVEEYYYGHQVDLETYIWRDGYGDWVPLNQVAEFAHLAEAAAAGHGAAATGGGYDALAGLGEDDGATRQVSLESVYGDAGQAPPEEEPEESTRIMSMDSVGQHMGGGLDAAAAAEPAADPFGGVGGGSGFDDFGGGGDPFGTASSDDDDADLGSIFGAAAASAGVAPASASDGGDDSLAALGASASGGGSSLSGGGGGGGGPRRTANDLVGARSENSVLFSLSNLQAIGKPSGGDKGDLPTTEGSGLIDIKALAATQAAAPADTRQSFAAGPAASSSGGGDAFDGSVIPVPAMMPMGTRKSNTGLIIGIAAGAVIILGLLTLVIVLAVGGGDETPPAQAQTTEEDPVETPELGGTAVAGQGQVVAQNTAMGQPGAAGMPVAGQPGTAGAVAAPGTAGSAGAAGAAPADGTAAAAAAGTPTDGAAADGATADGETEAAADATASAAAEKKEDEKSTTRRSSRSDRKRDDKKEDEKKEPEEKKPEKKEPEEKKPEKKEPSGGSLSKADVNKVIRGSFGKVRTCSRNADAKGKLNIKFGIKGDGRVSGASVASSEFKGTKVGACVVKVVESMKFPAHGGDTVNVTYPFHIN